MPIINYLKRKWLSGKPFPREMEIILTQDVPVYQKIPGILKDIFKKRLVIFMHEKQFEGCGGLKMTEKKKVVISAYACILLTGSPSDYYPDLRAILLYPGDYLAPVNETGEGGIVTVGKEHRKGEFWSAGNIVLSWSDIKKNIYGTCNGQNLIYHEFAHYLDYQYGLTAGIDENGTILREDEWTRTLAFHYRKLRRTRRGRTESVLDKYGASNPSEFFSVVTEAFFEKPVELHNKIPDLYSAFKSFYNLDPVSW